MIKAGDPSSFRLYYNFLLKFQSTKSKQSWNVLDLLKTLSLMISKFPRHISGRRNRQALTIRMHHLRGLSLSDIIAFVEKETILVNDPLFSNNAVEIYLDKTKESAQKRMKYFTTKTEEQKSQEEVWSRCLICNKNHDLDPCNQ